MITNVGLEEKLNMAQKVAVVFDNVHSGFRVITKLKNKGYQVKSFKPTNFVVSKAEDVDIVVLNLPVRHKKIENLMNELNGLRATVVAISDKGDISFWKRFTPVKFIINHIDELDDVLDDSFKGRFDFCVCDAKGIDSELNDGEDVVFFKIKGFSRDAVKKLERMLNEIFNDLKRSDRFFVVLDCGIVIVPANQGDILGVEALKKKVDRFLEGRFAHFNGVEFVGSAVYRKGESFKSFSDLIKKETTINIKIDFKRSKSAKVVFDDIRKADANTLYTASKLVAREVFAKLWFSEKYRKYVDPFIDLGVARIITQIKGKVKQEEIEEAERAFFDRVKDVLMEKSKISRESFLDSIKEEDQLMSLPEVQRNIIMLINEEAPFRKIVREIEKDPAITSKVLKFANSVFYGLKKEIKSIEKAAVVLGTEELLGISLSISYLSSSKSIYTKKLYKYSIATLAIAKYIESLANIRTGITLGAVVHVIGDMFYAQHFPDMFGRVIKGVRNGLPYEVAQSKVLPVPVEELGEFLAKRWSFPDRVVKTIRYYPYPRYAGIDTAIHLVHAASVLAKSFGYFFGQADKDDLNYHTYSLFLKKFNVNLLRYFEDVGDIKEKINEMMFILL